MPAASRSALFSSATDDWPTPQDFFDRLDGEFGFVLDVCASAANHKAPQFYALDHPDEQRRDGLGQDWAADAGGEPVWMNPPYGRGIADWMAKAHSTAQAGATVVCLVPVRADARWWHDLVLTTGAEVRYVRGRLKFGAATTSAPFASAVVVYRSGDVAGAPGMVAVMPAKAPTPAAAETAKPVARLVRRTNGARQDPASVEKRIAAYTPTIMSAEQWQLCAGPVRDAVRTLDLENWLTAVSYLGSLSRFLISGAGWDRQSTPDLPTLLSAEAVAAMPPPVGLSARRHRACQIAVSILARANGWQPALQPLRLAKQRPIHPLMRAHAGAPVPGIAVFAAWQQATGRKPGSSLPLEPLLSALRHDAMASGSSTPSTNDCNSGAGTLQATAALRSLSEATDIDGPNVTSKTKGPEGSAPTNADSKKDTSGRQRAAVAATRAASGRPPTRAEVLRYRKTVAAARAAAHGTGPIAPAPAVPPAISAALDAFVPQKPSRKAWKANHELAVRLVLGYQPTSVRNTSSVASQVALFLAWFSDWPARDITGPVQPGELVKAGVVEAWLASSDRADTSKATMRCILRRCIKSLYPGAAPAKLAYRPVVAPYTAEEMTTWRFLARNQPTDTAAANLCLLVGLCAGAGLDTADLRHLNADAFTEVWLDANTSVLMVSVTGGTRDRTVPVRATYRPLVEHALKIRAKHAPADDRGGLLLGRVAERNNVAPAKARAAKTATSPAVVQVSRLRNTWLVAQLAAPVPLVELLAAAGLRSSRTLMDLLEHCPEPDVETVARLLAGVQTPGQDVNR